MTVSVIIPSYQGAHKLPAVLNALSAQSHRTFELIIALDGSNDASETVLEAYRKQLPQLRYKNWPNGGRAVVRNRGAALATGDLLIFFDDDMRPEPDCVARHIAHHKLKPQSILTGSQIEDFAWVKNDIQRYKGVLARSWEQRLPDAETPMKEDALHLTAANCSIPTEVFKQLGGFDERLTDAEDYELAVRAKATGTDIYFDKAALAWHDDAITCAKYIKRRREYAQARSKLVAMVPILAQHLPVHDRRQLPALQKVIYHYFARRWWVRQADAGRLKLIPTRLRDRIYTWIIWGMAVYHPERRL